MPRAAHAQAVYTAKVYLPRWTCDNGLDIAQVCDCYHWGNEKYMRKKKNEPKRSACEEETLVRTEEEK